MFIPSSGRTATTNRACRNRRVSLVHGDWSPKNILVLKVSNVLAIDFECIHFGDPSFDAAFLLNHLLLKTFHGIAGAEDLARIFWSTLQAEMPAMRPGSNKRRWSTSARYCWRVSTANLRPNTSESRLSRNTFARSARDLILDPPPSIAEVWKRYAADH